MTYQTVFPPGIVSNAFQGLPEIVKARFGLKTKLMEHIEHLEGECGAGCMDCCREPSPTHELSPFADKKAIAINAFAESNTDLVDTSDVTDYDRPSLLCR